MSQWSIRPVLRGTLLSALVALAILMATGQVGRTDLRMSYDWRGDGKEVVMVVQNILADDASARLAAPYGYEAFPPRWVRALRILSSPCEHWLLHLIHLAVPDVVMTINIYFLLTFVLTAMTGAYALRRLGLPPAFALVVSELYAFLPYHYWRSMTHWGEHYYLVPLLALLLLWQWSASPVFFRRRGGTWRFRWRNRKALVAIFVLFFCLNNNYQGWFFVVLAPLAGLGGALYRRSVVHLCSALLMVVLIGASCAKAHVPDLLWRWADGPGYGRRAAAAALVHGPTDIARYGEAEVFGLKLAQLFLPIPDHRLGPLRNLSRMYNASNPLVNENVSTTLGLVGSLGLLVLMARVLFLRHRPLDVHGKLGALALAALLVGTVGGFGSLLSTVVHRLRLVCPDLAPLLLLPDQIRCYNRIVVFVAFFALAAAGFIAAWFARVCARGLARRGLQAGPRRRHARATAEGLVAGCMLCGGLLDMLPPWPSCFAVAGLPAFTSDREMMGQVEVQLGANAAVFQLPFNLHHRTPWDDRRFYTDYYAGYGLTRTLEWSFGADPGTPQAHWYEQTACLAPNAMLEELRHCGFSGILVDRAWYADGDRALEQALEANLGYPPLASRDGRYALFTIAPRRSAE